MQRPPRPRAPGVGSWGQLGQKLRAEAEAEPEAAAATAAAPAAEAGPPAAAPTEKERRRAALQREARKSKVDAVTGKVRCLACGKALADFRTLEQHLKDKHFGLNSPEAKLLEAQAAPKAGRPGKPGKREPTMDSTCGRRAAGGAPRRPGP